MSACDTFHFQTGSGTCPATVHAPPPWCQAVTSYARE